MPAFARVQSGIVVELFSALPTFVPAVMATVHPCNDNVALGWTYDGSTFAAPAGPDLATAKATRKGEVVALYQTKLAAGMPYGGKVLQIDEDSQLRITGAAAAAGLVGHVPASGWRMADNTFLALADAAAMIALASAAAAQVEALRVVMWGHKDAIDALSDVSSVQSYDITSGW
jgi:hypothetical protein